MDEARKLLDSYMEEFASGNPSHFDEFYRLTHKKMFYIALGIVENKEDAEDVIQESYAKMIGGLSSYSVGSNPFAFLASIVRNESYSLLRKRKEVLSYEDGIHSSSASHDSYSDADGLLRMLSRLNQDERDIVIMHVVDDMKFAEIAKAMGKGLSATLVAYHRAMKKLRKEAGQ